MKRKIFIYLLSPILLTACLMSGCRVNRRQSLKPDDVISCVINEKLGDKVDYCGKEKNDERALVYKYILRVEDGDLIYDMIENVNTTINKQKIAERIKVLCYREEICGVEVLVAGFCNYSDLEDASPIYSNIQSMAIYGYHISDSPDIYSNPLTYVDIPDIKYLKVSEYMQRRALRTDIKWHENWKELNQFVVIPDEEITCVICNGIGNALCYRGEDKEADISRAYKYIVNIENDKILYDVMKLVNPVIKREKINEPVSIAFYSEEKIGEAKKIVRLSNYADEEEPSAEYEGIQVLTIYGKAEDGEDYFYNNPSVYAGLPGIKYLKVSAAIQERARVQNIDWHEYWPELEMVEVLE